MGRFDETIAHYRNQLEQATRGDHPFRFRIWGAGKEITQERDDRREQNKNMFQRLIDAYAKHND
jgi:hypothetical protein